MAEDEDVDKEYIETNRDAVMIAALPWVVGDTISAKVIASHVYGMENFTLLDGKSGVLCFAILAISILLVQSSRVYYNLIVFYSSNLSG